MKRDVRALLYDIQHAASSIDRYLEGLDRQACEKNELVQDAVERNFITIGEAIRRMRLLGEDIRLKAGELAGATDFRNVLVHEYEDVSHERVWEIVHTALPLLKQQIGAWAAELGMEAPPE